MAGRPIPHTQVPLDVLWEHAPEVAKVMAWANETFYDIDLAPVRRAFPGLMDFGTWLDRSGKERLLAQPDSLAA